MTTVHCDVVTCVHNNSDGGNDHCNREEIEIDQAGECDDREIQQEGRTGYDEDIYF